MTPAEFHVAGDIVQSTWYVKEIKELYQKNILKENGIISFEEYSKEKDRLIQAYREHEKNSMKYGQQIKAAQELGLL